MEALEAVRGAIRARRSVRSGFLPQPVGRELLLELVGAGVCAPSGSNTQSIRFLVESRPEEIRRLAGFRRLPGDILAGARALILVFADRSAVDWTGHRYSDLWRRLAYQDAAAAIQNILLLATAAGLGSCWISADLEMEGTPLLAGQTWAAALAPYRLPASQEIVGIVMLGHIEGPPAGDVTHHGRPVARRPVREYILGFDGVRP